MDTPYPFNLSGVSKDTLFQVYCLNPPPDSCEFGPCPNSDVTGIGQQVSLYITSTIFAITIVHSPIDIRLASYGYLANVYSLLISALISILKVQLTKNDAIFVLIATVSPATLYIWIIATFAPFTGLPKRISHHVPNKPERVVLTGLYFTSFLLWLVMLFLVILPSHHVKFSQPGCSRVYGADEFVSLLWSASLLLRSLVTMVILLGIARYLTRQQKHTLPPTLEVGSDLIHWTRASLQVHFRYLTPPGLAALLFLMQGSVIEFSSAAFNFEDFQSLPLVIIPLIFGAFLPDLLAFAFWLFALFSSSRFRPAQRVLLLLLPCGIILLEYLPGSHVSLPDFLNGVCWSTIWWKSCVRRAGQSSITFTLMRLSLIALIVLTTLSSVIVPFMPLFAILPTTISPHLWWLCAWEVFSFHPTDSEGNIAKLWSNIMDSAPLFKFTYLIMGPTIAWIQSTLIANPTKSNTMTFGQIFALIVSCVSLSSLVITISEKENKRAIWRAVWMVERENNANPPTPCPNISVANEKLAIAVQQKIEEVLAAPDRESLPIIAYSGRAYATLVDHTLLGRGVTMEQINKLCGEAVKYNFKSCCVSGLHVKAVADRLQYSQCIPCAVVGFPLGTGKSCVKAFEGKEAVQDGAKEVDMVINIDALTAGDYTAVYDDIREVVTASGVPVKVILETVFLTDEEKIAGSFLAAEAGALFVSTCTGFSGGETTAADVALMRKAVQYKTGVKVKASGGIKTINTLLEMVHAGAERIGTSDGVAIIDSINMPVI